MSIQTCTAEIQILHPKRHYPDTLKYLKYIEGQSPKLCKHIVAHTYIQQVIAGIPDYVFLITQECTRTRSKKTSVQILGFALVFKKSTNIFYIDIVCAAKGYGSRLIRKIQEQAKIENIRFVSLSALAYVVGYYYKFGFLNTSSHEICGTKQMMKKMKQTSFSDKKELDDFLIFLVNKKFIKQKACTTLECAGQEGYPMTWCNPDWSR